MKVTLTISPNSDNQKELSNLFEAMNKSGITCDVSPNLDKVIVDLDRQATAVKILNLHGFEVQQTNKHLSGAIQELSEKYQIDEDEVEDPDKNPDDWEWRYYRDYDSWLDAASFVMPDDWKDTDKAPLKIINKGVLRAEWMPRRKEGYIVFPIGGVSGVSEGLFSRRNREEDKEESDPQVYQVKLDKKQLVGFLQRKIRETHGKRKKKRATHARDELNGKIRAFEEVLRKVRNL